MRSAEAVVFTLARRLAIDVRRSAEAKRRKVSLDAPLPGAMEGDGATLASLLPAGGPDPRQRAVASEEARLVAEAMERLEPDAREIVVLRLVEGLSAREVAGILGLAEGTVWSRLHRALATLRERLGPLLGRGGGGASPPAKSPPAATPTPPAKPSAPLLPNRP